MWVFFGKSRNDPLNITAAQKIYNLAKQKSGVEKGKGIHTLRHCFATHLLEAGVDLVTIKTRLGHNSFQSTQGYLQIRQPKVGSTTSPLACSICATARCSRAPSCRPALHEAIVQYVEQEAADKWIEPRGGCSDRRPKLMLKPQDKSPAGKNY